MRIPPGNHAAPRALVWLMTLLVVGCGVKAPPIAPDIVLPPAVVDLEGSRDGDALVLRWTAPAGPDWEASRPAGFRVYKGSVSLSGPDCPTCPRTFVRVADVPLSEGRSGPDGALRFSHRETLERGVHHSFKVAPYSRDGVMGEGSNVIDIDYP